MIESLEAAGVEVAESPTKHECGDAAGDGKAEVRAISAYGGLSAVTDQQSNTPADEAVAVYRYFRRRWADMLNGDDEHAICRRITFLLDADLQFRTISHSRLLSDRANLKQNGNLHLFVDQGFIAHQSLLIRQLTDPRASSTGRSVFSLPTILEEIGERREIITREAFTRVDGGPYYNRLCADNMARHSTFDKLSSVSEYDRTPADRIAQSYLKSLGDRLKSADSFRAYVNKYLAHAAAPDNRGSIHGFPFDQLETVYRDLIYVANQISGRLLWTTHHTFLPFYAVDVIDGLDSPICRSEDLPELRTYLRTRNHELEELERNAGSVDLHSDEASAG